MKLCMNILCVTLTLIVPCQGHSLSSGTVDKNQVKDVDDVSRLNHNNNDALESDDVMEEQRKFELGRKSGEIRWPKMSDIRARLRRRRDADETAASLRARTEQQQAWLIERIVEALALCARTGDCPQSAPDAMNAGDFSDSAFDETDNHSLDFRPKMSEFRSEVNEEVVRPADVKRAWLQMDDKEWEKRERQLRPIYDRHNNNWNDAMRNAWG